MHPNDDLPAGARDFDFLLGEWRVINRRLTERLAGADSWDVFPATLEVEARLGGLGNVDRFRAVWNGRHIDALTLRVFNPETQLWSLYWVDNISAELQPPLIGKFRDGRGEFFARDRHEGTPILVRFVWRDITENSAVWEQAFSVDDGDSWETNWIMEFERRP